MYHVTHSVWLRNIKTLAVNSLVINHSLVEVSFKVDYVTSAKRGWYIYLFYNKQTNYDLLLINNSRTRANPFRFSHTRYDEKAVVSFRFFQLSAMHWKLPDIYFSCNTDVYMYFLRLICAKTTLHRLTTRKHGRWEGWRHKTAAISVTQFRPVICYRIKHDSVPLAI